MFYKPWFFYFLIFWTGLAWADDRDNRGFLYKTYRDNQEIVEEMPNQKKMSLQEESRAFLNQDRVDNQNLMRMRLRQKQISGDISSYPFFADHPDYIMMTVAGLSADQDQALQQKLTREIGFIQEMVELDKNDHVAVFALKLKRMGVKQFVEILDGYPVGGFALELINYERKSMNFILK